MERPSQSHSKSNVVGILTALLFAGSTLVPPKSLAQEVIVRLPPPPVRVETVPPPPTRYYVWDPGHWRWDGRAYVWVPGHYIHNPHHSANWVPGHWVERHGGWSWVQGHWRH
jgi:WXXGXW repeat (2 copies)